MTRVANTVLKAPRTTELAQTNRELKQLRVQLAALEERRAALLAELAEHADRPA